VGVGGVQQEVGRSVRFEQKVGEVGQLCVVLSRKWERSMRVSTGIGQDLQGVSTK